MAAITPLSPGPSTADPANFDARGDQLLSVELPRLVTEINALEVSLRAAAQPLGMPYTFSAATADADPGAGNLRASTATFVAGAAIVLRMDLLDNLGVTRTPQLDQIGSASNPIKSVVRIQKPGDGSQFVDIVVTAIASPAGYKNITGTVLAASSAAPFADSDPLVVMYVRNGDQGATGPVATYTQIGSVTVAGTPTTVTFSSIPQTYSDLLLVLDVATTGGTGYLQIELANSAGTFTLPVGITAGSGLSAFRGQVDIRGYRLDFQSVEARIEALVGASPLASQVNASVAAAMKVIGGVTGVRLSASASGTFTNGGVIKLFGK